MNLIGASVLKKDGPDKVTGRAKFTTDYTATDLLHVKMVTSPHAHAKILSINTSKASKMPGVKAIVTGKDYPGLVGVLYEDHPILAKDKVRYNGEAIAIVVANSLAEAKDAANAIEIEYEELPLVNCPKEAFKEGATLVHENMESYRIITGVNPRPNTNISNHVMIRKGNMEKAWEESEVQIKASFSVPQADHISMEPRNVRVEIKPDGRVIIHTSSQAPFVVRQLISRYFNIDAGKITVITPYVGGGFGGKAAVQLEFIAYLASLAVGGKMVKLVNTREEDIATSPVKIGLETDIKIGCTKAGEFKAMEVTFLVDGGAYSNMAVGITKSIASDCTGPYNIENVHCDSYCMYTNHPFATSYRGFGHGEFTFGLERTIDMLAEKLNMDPMELRIKNAIKQGDTSPTQAAITKSNSGDLIKCIEKLKSTMDWDVNKVQDMGNGKIRAKGISCLWKSPSTPQDAMSGAVVTFNADRSVNLSIGSTEIGPGTKTTLSQILAEKMKMDIDKVHVNMEVNTEENPVHWKTVASMTTYMVGKAVIEAAENAIVQLKSIGSIVLRCPPEDLGVGQGRVFIKDDPNFYIDITEIVYGYKYENGNSIGGQIIGHGSYIMKHLTSLDPISGSGKVGPSWTVGAQGVEIELDTKDYTYKILKAYSVLDVGKIINPKGAKGVVMGGMSMGMGLATREGLIYNEKGILQNPNLRIYRIISYGEEAEYIIDFIETPQIEAAYGGRGIGEQGLVGMPAAVGNAVSLAAKVNISKLPITPELIWQTKGGKI